MTVLKPHYTLDHGMIEGAVATIPAREYVAMTSQRYPYPRLGTRAAHYTLGDGDVLVPHYTLADGGTLKPHYTLDSMEVQGVMPAETYYALTGKIVTTGGPELPKQRMSQVLVETTQPVSLQLDWAIGGFILGILTGWGLTQALVEAAKRKVGKWGE